MLVDVKVMGRHVEKDGILYLAFSGAYIEFEFTGKKVSAEIVTDYANDEKLVGFLGVFVDGEFLKKIKLDKEDGEYIIYEASEEKKAVIRVMRFAETNFGKAGFKKLVCDGEMKRTPDKKRKIEYIGNSITCGYGVEAANELEDFRTETENPAKAWAVLAAEELDADFELVCWSGNGLVSHYIPPEVDEADTGRPMMQEVYVCTDYAGSEFEGFDEPPKFDFDSFIPDYVVINLGTNDASYTRKIPERVAAFEKAYGEFLKTVREKRKEAVIICCLGVLNMDLCDAVKSAVKKSGDPNIFFLSQPIQDIEKEGAGANWHPSALTQKRSARELVDFIKRIQK